jgi:hypothetical protein
MRRTNFRSHLEWNQCARCRIRFPEVYSESALCDDCRRFCYAAWMYQIPKHIPEGDEPNPWQENVIRELEDVA